MFKIFFQEIYTVVRVNMKSKIKSFFKNPTNNSSSSSVKQLVAILMDALV